MGLVDAKNFIWKYITRSAKTKSKIINPQPTTQSKHILGLDITIHTYIHTILTTFTHDKYKCENLKWEKFYSQKFVLEIIFQSENFKEKCCENFPQIYLNALFNQFTSNISIVLCRGFRTITLCNSENILIVQGGSLELINMIPEAKKNSGADEFFILFYGIFFLSISTEKKSNSWFNNTPYLSQLFNALTLKSINATHFALNSIHFTPIFGVSQLNQTLLSFN